MVQPYSDAMDRAYELATKRIDRQLKAFSLSQTDVDLRVDYGSQGNLLIYRTRTRDGQKTTEADYIAVLDNGLWLSETDLKTIDRHTSRAIRRYLRKRSICAAGQDHDKHEPAWSYTMHRLARAIFLETKIDPVMLSNITDTAAYTAVGMLGEQAGLVLGPAVVEDGHIDVHTLRWRNLEFGGNGQPFVIIDQPIPETVATALAGRMLSEAISHPAVQRAHPIRISWAETNDSYTTFILEDVEDFIRRPPVGIDRRWRRIPFLPTRNN